MSRAFVKEIDDPGPERTPELPVSAHPNLVTKTGLEGIDAELARLEAQIADGGDEATLAALRREQRYWSIRRASAQLTRPDPASGRAGFGSRLTVRRDGRRPETVRIVGEDEADPQAGLVSWTSPLAAALMDAEAGETVELETREPPIVIEVLEVDNH